MNISRKLKDNRFLRGIYTIWSRNFGGMNRLAFGYIADNVTITTPLSGDMKNVYVYEKAGIGPHA